MDIIDRVVNIIDGRIKGDDVKPNEVILPYGEYLDLMDEISKFDPSIYGKLAIPAFYHRGVGILCGDEFGD